MRELKSENKEMKQTLHLMAKALRDVAEACPESAAVQSIIASLPSEVLLIGDSGLPPRAGRARPTGAPDLRPPPGGEGQGGADHRQAAGARAGQQRRRVAAVV